MSSRLPVTSLHHFLLLLILLWQIDFLAALWTGQEHLKETQDLCTCWSLQYVTIPPYLEGSFPFIFQVSTEILPPYPW